MESADESDSITVQSLLEHADENLYISKAPRGGNRVTCSKSNGVDARAREPVNQRSTHVKPKASVGSVDDDPDIRAVVQTTLCLMAGLNVRTAACGEEAIEQA